MEYFSLFNVIMALVIAVIIVVISILKNPMAKAIVYSLPIPITLALIASQKEVDESHIAGLFLLTGFLWLVNTLHKRGVGILSSDILSTLTYVIIGYWTIKLIPHGSFYLSAAVYFLFWVAFMSKYKFVKTGNIEKERGPNMTIKGVLIFSIALALLSAKDVLMGIVVTFPFSGVFAVIEMQRNLEILAAEWTKNSLAVLCFFITIHLLSGILGIYLAIFLGWVVYLIVLKLIRTN